jgi:seryl-tRNA synthetase
MIDIKFLRDNPDAVRASQTGRGEDASIVDRVMKKQHF